ncbi:hypothetical protein FRB93_010294 [Tulasnella sp. JGI-2019a]|nr:hypothetical protein FRB93_010294 [Tulasnella sp. JGI-2019a]
MTLSTTTAAFTITPVVISTFFTHLKRKLRKKNIRNKDDTEAVDDLLFEEAFHIVKAFLELATRNTVDELQSFTNTYVPPPFWAEVVSCTVPLECCNKSADILIDWFGPEQLKTVVGGERWWQVRGLQGIQGEWIAMKRDWAELRKAEKKGIRPEKGRGHAGDVYSNRMNDLQSVIFYITGGGFYFGSINTHRYQIIRLARKLGGRAFAVNYRKAPQYPWPCPLQDVLAAYLYLIRPPLGAPHTAIDPKRLVVAGDSAGGNLTLSLLVLLRDMSLPMPAGAVLISPWVDLTHSFPSVIANTKTDIIPPHGFCHKPSTMWPIPTTGPRAVKVSDIDVDQQAESEGGKRPPGEGNEKEQERPLRKEGSDDTVAVPMVEIQDFGASGGPPAPLRRPTVMSASKGSGEPLGDKMSKVDEKIMDPQKIRLKVDGEAMEIRSQIQLYATNLQITHPLVSPLLNSSLGGLCPLYILSGDHEVLRDEVVYLAHRAADPQRFPIREGLMNTPRQVENAKKYTQGTQVHFQLFDDMCHVLTVFSFTNSANFAYRGIARFAKRVIESSVNEVKADPFPEQDPRPPITPEVSSLQGTPVGLDEANSPSIEDGAHIGRTRAKHSDKLTIDDVKLTRGVSGTSAQGGRHEPNTIRILCERVSIHGITRSLECDDEIEALKLPCEDVGTIKEAPVKRWLEGQGSADRSWKHSGKGIERKRVSIEAKAMRLIDLARSEGLLDHDGQPTKDFSGIGNGHMDEKEPDGTLDGFYTDSRKRWSPLDLQGERPSPTAVAGRRDTSDALTLLRATFAPSPAPAHPEKGKREDMIMSPAEQQRVSKVIPGSHGVRIWSGLMSKFMKTNLKKKAAHPIVHPDEGQMSAIGDSDSGDDSP